ncbi:hypothetical protein ABH988_007612 [Bradyrhizobium ottawaense]
MPWIFSFRSLAMSSADAARLASAASISLARFCTKRSPTRIAGTSMAAMTRISNRVRRLIGGAVRSQAYLLGGIICGTIVCSVHSHWAKIALMVKDFTPRA